LFFKSVRGASLSNTRASLPFLPTHAPAVQVESESDESEAEPDFHFTATASSAAATDAEVLLFALLIMVLVTRPESTITLAAWLKELAACLNEVGSGAKWASKGIVMKVLSDAVSNQRETELGPISLVLRDYVGPCGGYGHAQCLSTLRKYISSVKRGVISGPHSSTSTQLNKKTTPKLRHVAAIAEVAKLLSADGAALQTALEKAGLDEMRLDCVAASPTKDEQKRRCAELEHAASRALDRAAKATKRRRIMSASITQARQDAQEAGRAAFLQRIEPRLRAALEADQVAMRARELKAIALAEVRKVGVARRKANELAAKRLELVAELHEKMREQKDALADMQQRIKANDGAAARLAAIPALLPARGAGAGRGAVMWPTAMRFLIFEQLVNNTPPSAVAKNITGIAATLVPWLDVKVPTDS
jgi:hypothetical protein